MNIFSYPSNIQAFTKCFLPMKPLQTYNVFLKVFLLICIVMLSACRTNTVVKRKTPDLSGIKKILILPFKNMAAVFGEGVDGRCPVCGKVFTTGKVAEDAADILTEDLFNLLKDRKDFELIPSSQAQGVMAGLLAENKPLKTPMTWAFHRRSETLTRRWRTSNS